MSRTCRIGFKHVLKFYANFFAKIFRKTRMRRSCECRELSLRNFGELTMRNFCNTCTNVMRVSYNGLATVLRKHANTSRLSDEKIKLSDIRTNVV